jgi:hypothetical protein
MGASPQAKAVPGAGIEPAASASSVRRCYRLSYPGLCCGPGRTRTYNLTGKSRLHFPLCYRPASAADRVRTCMGKAHLGLSQARLPVSPRRQAGRLRGQDSNLHYLGQGQASCQFDYPAASLSTVAGGGVEPPSADSKSAVLPLDDPAGCPGWIRTSILPINSRSPYQLGHGTERDRRSRRDLNSRSSP